MILCHKGYSSSSQFIVLIQVIHDFVQHINSINFTDFSIYDDGLCLQVMEACMR